MRRRHFLALALLSAATAVRGQTAKAARVGYLSIASPPLDRDWIATFRDQLRTLGYTEGTNLRIEQRHADGHAEKMAGLLDELTRAKVDVLVVYGAWHIADKLRGATPVVVTVVPDPVGLKMVASLARPGGNITGFSDAHAELVPKRLELIKEVAPAVTRVAVLHFTSEMAMLQVRTAEAAAKARGITLVRTPIRGPQPEEVDRAFALMVKERAGAVLVISESTVSVNRRRIVDLAVKHRMVIIGTVRDWAEAGALLSYGTNFHELWRRSAIYVDKILKGARPGDLPIEQPTTFDLTVNQRTAKAIGIEVPRALLLRADRIIE